MKNLLLAILAAGMLFGCSSPSGGGGGGAAPDNGTIETDGGNEDAVGCGEFEVLSIAGECEAMTDPTDDTGDPADDVGDSNDPVDDVVVPDVVVPDVVIPDVVIPDVVVPEPDPEPDPVSDIDVAHIVVPIVCTDEDQVREELRNICVDRVISFNDLIKGNGSWENTGDGSVSFTANALIGGYNTETTYSITRVPSTSRYHYKITDNRLDHREGILYSRHSEPNDFNGAYRELKRLANIWAVGLRFRVHSGANSASYLLRLSTAILTAPNGWQSSTHTKIQTTYHADGTAVRIEINPYQRDNKKIRFFKPGEQGLFGEYDAITSSSMNSAMTTLVASAEHYLGRSWYVYESYFNRADFDSYVWTDTNSAPTSDGLAIGTEEADLDFGTSYVYAGRYGGAFSPSSTHRYGRIYSSGTSVQAEIRNSWDNDVVWKSPTVIRSSLAKSTWMAYSMLKYKMKQGALSLSLAGIYGQNYYRKWLGFRSLGQKTVDGLEGDHIFDPSIRLGLQEVSTAGNYTCRGLIKDITSIDPEVMHVRTHCHSQDSLYHQNTTWWNDDYAMRIHFRYGKPEHKLVLAQRALDDYTRKITEDDGTDGVTQHRYFRMEKNGDNTVHGYYPRAVGNINMDDLRDYSPVGGWLTVTPQPTTEYAENYGQGQNIIEYVRAKAVTFSFADNSIYNGERNRTFRVLIAQKQNGHTAWALYHRDDAGRFVITNANRAGLLVNADGNKNVAFALQEAGQALQELIGRRLSSNGVY